jgi:hypothetical protein
MPLSVWLMLGKQSFAVLLLLWQLELRRTGTAVQAVMVLPLSVSLTEGQK